jgi:DME family drug/metabolite transporter
MSRSLLPAILSRPRTAPSGGGPAGPVQIAAAGLLWGTSGVVVNLLHRATGLHPVGIGFYRLAIAAAVLVVLARQAPALVAALRRAPLSLAVIGVGLGAYQALYFCAVALGGVAMATVVSLGLAPLLIAGWETLRARRLPSRGMRGSLAVAVTGLTLITGLQAAPTAALPQPRLGLLAAAGSGLGYAATTILSRRIAGQVQPMTLTTASTAIGAVALAPVALIAGGVGFPVRAGAVALLAYQGVVATAVAYGLFYSGLRTTVGSAATVLTLLEAPAAAVLAVLILGEPLSGSMLAGGALVLGAVLMTHRSARPAVPPAGDAP